MLFSSQVFIFLFLPAVLLAYYISFSNREIREWMLVLGSLFFYAYWDVRFLPLLVVSIVLNWALGKIYVKRPKFGLLGAGIAVNLAVLGFFKYWNFFAETFASLMGDAYQPTDILLPLGISFFTFQQISYLVDLKKGQAQAYALRSYALYIAFFPQLIAGPIVRHNELIPQFANPYSFMGFWRSIALGLVLFTIGFCKKVLFADRIAQHVDAVFNHAVSGIIATQDAWTAMIGFTMQIYFDFSAYTDMAIGIALLFGFKLPENFSSPLKSRNIREFWRRWHMTLSRFFRDYMYISMGGSRHGLLIQTTSLLATMGICGLWHGAGWTYVIWGSAHGIGLIVVNLWEKIGIRLPAFISWIITINFVIFTFVIFRAPNLEIVGTIWTAMLGLGPSTTVMALYLKKKTLLLGWLTILCLPKAKTIVETAIFPWRIIASLLGIGFAILILEVGKGKPIDFIYFVF